MSVLTLELVAPESLVVSRAAVMVTVPGEDGDFGVLPGHAALVSLLRPGVLRVKWEDASIERYFVAGGFAEVTPHRCTVLAREAVPMADLDRVTLESEVVALREELLVAEGDVAIKRLTEAITRLEFRLTALAEP